MFEIPNVPLVVVDLKLTKMLYNTNDFTLFTLVQTKKMKSINMKSLSIRLCN